VLRSQACLLISQTNKQVAVDTWEVRSSSVEEWAALEWPGQDAVTVFIQLLATQRLGSEHIVKVNGAQVGMEDLWQLS
jgi:predicted ThiF/HesA family dinucleotide-utilizing enzyme